MKPNLRLFFWFGVILLLFTAAITFYEHARARRYKSEALEAKLDAYADAVDSALSDGVAMDSLMRLFPPEIRVTLIDSCGRVFYDNALADVTALGNHAEREEIVMARRQGQSSSVRLSVTNGIEYLYYAKRSGRHFVRVALPYDVEVKHFLRVDNGFLYFTLLLFLLSLLFVVIAARLFGQSLARFREVVRHEQARRLKQEMTGNIAHELRTPVTSIRGYLETILDQRLDADREHQFLTKAYAQTLTLSELIGDMGLLSKIEAAPDSFALARVGMRALVERVRDDLAHALDERAMSVENLVAPEVQVRGNENLLYSILRNLMDNAVKYAGVKARVSVACIRAEGGLYHFTFADNGPGIADERHLSRIFERFYRISEGRTRDSGGSGLGLSIVRNAVAFHKGTISVSNRAGGGLEFRFTLPAAK